MAHRIVGRRWTTIKQYGYPTDDKRYVYSVAIDRWLGEVVITRYRRQKAHPTMWRRVSAHYDPTNSSWARISKLLQPYLKSI